MNINRILTTVIIAAATVSTLTARTIYVSPSGNDKNKGTLKKPVATFHKAHSLINGGDTVCFRGGTYRMTDADIMSHNKRYALVCNLDKAGTAAHRTCYMGFPGERPVFDFSDVKAEGYRISAFTLTADYVHMKNFDIVGVPVRIKGHTQSECVSGYGGSHCIVEDIAMHDGMAIGYYQTMGSDNLVVNCDAYNNYDDYSEGEYGGNVDGFGFHLHEPSYTGNRISGCRAWRNSDDGYDFINCFADVKIDHCIAFYNGYRPTKDPTDTQTIERAGDGNGFKCGGFGMKPAGQKNMPEVVPSHTITHCLAYNNKANGFYSNHHLGGNTWQHNSAMDNNANYEMRNRINPEEVKDVPGYGHTLLYNVSFAPRRDHLTMLDKEKSRNEANTFTAAAEEMDVTAEMFESVDPSTLFMKRNADGSLPDIPFMKAKRGSVIADKGWGWK